MTHSELIHACGAIEGLLLGLQIREEEETAGEALLDARAMMSMVTRYVRARIADELMSKQADR